LINISKKLARVMVKLSSACREGFQLKLVIGTIDKPGGAKSLKCFPIWKGDHARDTKFPIAASIQTADEGAAIAAADMLRFSGCYPKPLGTRVFIYATLGSTVVNERARRFRLHVL
jgi:hypothetical protein